MIFEKEQIEKYNLSRKDITSTIDVLGSSFPSSYYEGIENEIVVSNIFNFHSTSNNRILDTVDFFDTFNSDSLIFSEIYTKSFFNSSLTGNYNLSVSSVYGFQQMDEYFLFSWRNEYDYLHPIIKNEIIQSDYLVPLSDSIGISLLYFINRNTNTFFGLTPTVSSDVLPKNKSSECIVNPNLFLTKLDYMQRENIQNIVENSSPLTAHGANLVKDSNYTVLYKNLSSDVISELENKYTKVSSIVDVFVYNLL